MLNKKTKFILSIVLAIVAIITIIYMGKGNYDEKLKEMQEQKTGWNYTELI